LGEGGPFETTLRNSMLNYESARAWRQRSTHPALLEATGLDFCDDCYKIPVDEAGIYQPTYSDLQAAGIPVYPPGFIEPSRVTSMSTTADRR